MRGHKITFFANFQRIAPRKRMRAVRIRFRGADLPIRWKKKRNLCPFSAVTPTLTPSTQPPDQPMARAARRTTSSNSRYELVWIDVELRTGKDKAIERVFDLEVVKNTAKRVLFLI
ncbi:MAG: hypothetical protein AAB658_12515 [Chloroflexota bacterium]